MATPKSIKSIEDTLREQLRDFQMKHDGLVRDIDRAKQESAAWKAKYIESGTWRKYLPTAAVAVVIGFACGLIL